MQKFPHKLWIWLPALWLGICPLVWANNNDPLVLSQKIIQDNDLWPALEANLSDLEEQLFKDAADGHLDNFSLLGAALIASGVNDLIAIEHYEERVVGWVSELHRQGCMKYAPQRRAEAIFSFLHSRILRGGYHIECSDLRQALDEGRFNCVSATVLFNYLAGKLGLNCLSLETPGHALSRILSAEGSFDVENTCPRWFQLQHDPVSQAEAVEKTTGHPPVKDTNKLREISPLQLTGMIYYNRGVDLLTEKHFAQAAAANVKALRLDPTNNTTWGNFLATINNWSIELCNMGHYSQAAKLLRQGLAYDPHYEAFALNYVHVHHQWSEELCKEKRYQEAIDLLNQAAKEMPDQKQEYLQRTAGELYRRWVNVNTKWGDLLQDNL